MFTRSLGVAAALVLPLMGVSAADLTGVVVDPEGKPFAGARIYTPFSQTTLVTDAKGVFTLAIPANAPRGIPPGVVLAEGFVPKKLDLSVGGKPMTITLERGVSESGTVVDSEGKPQAGVRVKLMGTRDKGTPEGRFNYMVYPDFYEALTDSAGKWTLTGLPKDTPTQICVFDPRFLREPFEGESKRLITRPAAQLVGRVLGLEGMPRPGMTIMALPSTERSLTFVPQGVTAPDGTFTLGSLPPGEWQLVVSIPENDAVMEARSVTTILGKTESLGDLKLVAGVLVEGRVVEKGTDRGIAEVIVNAMGKHKPGATARYYALGGNRTDKNGVWKLRLLPGESEVSFQSLSPLFRSPNTSTKLTVPQGERLSVPAVELARIPVVTASVVDESGKPLAGVPLRIAPSNYNILRELKKTDASGQWSSEGDYTSYLDERLEHQLTTSPEWEVVSPERITLPLKSSPLKVVLRPNRQVPVTGRVLSTTGKPVAGAHLHVTIYKSEERRYEGRELPNIVTNERGEYRVPGVGAAELVRFGIMDRDLQPVKLGTLASGSRQLTDTIVENQNGTVRGKVLDTQGKPLAGVLVWGGTTREGTRTLTDASGTFTLTKFPESGGLLVAAKGALSGEVRAMPGESDVVVKLVPPPVRTPAQLAQRTKALIAEVRGLVEPGRDSRTVIWDCDYLANTLAEADAALAMEAGYDSKGKITEAVAGGVITVHSRVNAESMIPVLRRLIDTWENGYIRFYRAGDVCEGLYLTKPELARPWLNRALKESIGVDIDGVNLKLAAPALLLGGPALPALLTRLDKEKRPVEAAMLRVALKPEQATELLEKLPESERMRALCGAVSLGAKIGSRNTATLARLLIGQKTSQQDEYSVGEALSRAVRALGPGNPALALELAKKATGYFKNSTLALAAHVQPDPKQKEMLYRSILKDDDWGDHRATLILACEDVPTLREELRKTPQATEEYAVAMATVDPALSRWAAERALYGKLSDVYINSPEDARTLRQDAVALLAILDPLAALKLVDTLNENDARIAGKSWVAAMLLLPKEKRLALARSRIAYLP